MEPLGQAIGAILAGLPPMMGATVLIFGVFAALVYLWRTAGKDAKREREAGVAVKESLTIARLDAIKSQNDDIIDRVEAMQTQIAILLDRRK